MPPSLARCFSRVAWRRYTLVVASPGGPPAHAARVLVVDDEPGLREMISILLRRDGFDVTAAPGVRRAKEALASSPEPDPAGKSRAVSDEELVTSRR